MNKSLYANVFGWLFVGLLLTFTSGYLVSTDANLIRMFYNSTSLLVLAIVQIGLCIFLSARIEKMKPTVTKIIYILYTILSGVTFGSIFLVFKMSSIIMVFLVTAIVFGTFAIIGKTTKLDLSKLGIYLFMGLLAIIVLEIINLFLLNNTLDMILCVVGIVIFIGYTAYDMQQLDRLSSYGINEENLAIYGALDLYLDFINLFIRLLQIFGRERD